MDDYGFNEGDLVILLGPEDVPDLDFEGGFIASMKRLVGQLVRLGECIRYEDDERALFRIKDETRMPQEYWVWDAGFLKYPEDNRSEKFDSIFD